MRGSSWTRWMRDGLIGLAAIAAYLVIRRLGLHLPAADATGAAVAAPAVDLLAPVMLALAVVTLAARALGAAGQRWFGQPAVIGEILAGILLGPSLLGALWPAATAALFPPVVLPAIGLVAKIGVVLFMFLIGLEIDVGALRRTSRSTFAISGTGIVLPFLLGAALALLLYPRYGRASTGFTAFSLFVGVSLSLTAFPVLARILREFGVQHTAFGGMALACAAIGDVTAWTLLALVVGVTTGELGHALLTLPLLLAYLLAMVFVVAPLLRRLAARSDAGAASASGAVLSAIFVGLLLSAAATEFIGIHALFGAFFFGLLIPHDGGLARDLRLRIEDLVGILFLPAFFAFTGLRTRIGLLAGWEDWAMCALIVAAATVGKFGGTYIASRARRLERREAAALAVLMNTRGLVELIVLNVGLDLGVLSPRLFAMLVVMALVTTFATSPLFGWLSRAPRFGSTLVAPSASERVGAA